MTYEKGWDEMSWERVRRAQMRWSLECEECSVRCGAWWRVQCKVWSVECEESSEKWEVRRVQCEVWSVKCGVLRVQCEVTCWVRRVQCEVWSVECEAWSVECEECSVKCEVWSVKCEVELQMWHVKQDTTFAQCTHARAWLVHGACKFYRWESSYIFLRQLPPRLVRVLLVNHSAIGVPHLWTPIGVQCWQSESGSCSCLNQQSSGANMQLEKRCWWS